MEEQSQLRSRRGQILPVVLIVGAVLAVVAYALLFLFQNEVKLMVRHMDLDRKTELATIALEHARYKLQSGNQWSLVPLTGFQYDTEYTVPGLGHYTIDIIRGNLFMSNPADPATRQSVTDTRTVGIKVEVMPSKSTHLYYAVLKKVGYGGAIISKGVIDLPCTTAAVTGDKYNFFWGDIISANPSDTACRIPSIPVVYGTSGKTPWMPAVYAKGAIYTALSSSTFGYTYDDMSPTAKSHPYSTYAIAPNISIDGYKQLAKDQYSYYGPPTIGGSGAANPFYIADGNHDLADLTPLVMASRLSKTAHVLFIDTTDGLPMRVPSDPSIATNTYCGTTYVSSGTLSTYYDNCTQLYTVGSLIVNGPIVLKGDDPGPEPANSVKIDPLFDYWPSCYNILPPSNYYYPQDTISTDIYVYNATKPNESGLNNIKHAGFLYVTGELRIGGPRCNTPGTCMLPPAPKEKTIMEAVRDNLQGRVIAAARAVDNALVAPAYAVPKTDTPTKTPTPGGPTNTPTPDITDTPVPTATIAPCKGSIVNSSVIIYGTIYLESSASLTVDTVNDDPKFYVFYNEKANAFGYLQNNVIVTSFKEHTFLVPTPAPVYPF